jgi:hypothetical protein
MRFRKLRIAWSVVWGLFAVLLIVLWTRSYVWQEEIGYTFADRRELSCTSFRGCLQFVWDDTIFPQTPSGKWIWGSYHIKETYGNDPLKIATRPWNAEISTDYLYLGVPHWSLLLLTLGMAVIPWTRQLQRRFSLRTLLIATTLLAVILGLVVYAAS